MSVRYCAFAIALGLVPAAAAIAQDLEVFELETFVDPSPLTAIDSEGRRLDLGFFAAYVRGGAAYHYQYRTDFPHERGIAETTATGLVDKVIQLTTFADLTATYVRRRLQVTGRWTGFEPEGLDDSGRAEAQLGYYFITPPSENSPLSPPIIRLQLSAGRGNGPGLLGGTTIGVDIDGSANAPYEVVGGVSYAYHRPDERCRGECPPEEAEAHFLSADVRTEFREENRVSFDIGFGVGLVHRDDHTRWGTLRGEIRLKLPSPDSRRYQFYAVYSPALQLDGAYQGRRTNNEWAVFVHLRPWAVALP